MSNLIINLRGGTGNQLFQACAALSLAYTYKKKCQFSIDLISKDKYKRKLEIGELLENLGIRKRFLEKKNLIIYLDEYDIDHPLYFSEKSPLVSLKKDIQLEGYFLNYRIHNSTVKEKIKAYVRKLEINDKFKKLKFIAIHLRELHGTDGTQIKKKIDNIKIDYYSQAINKIISCPSLNGIKNAVVFCDTWKNPINSKLLPQIKALLKENGISYINGDKEIKSTLDIVNIFSLSKCSIISNSTLSWWGAYLSEGKIFSPVMNLWEPNLKIPDHWEQIYSGEIQPLTHHNQLIFEPLIKKEKDLNYRIYNSKRLLIIKIYRKFLNIFTHFNIFKSFHKYLIYLGLLKVNANKTFI